MRVKQQAVFIAKHTPHLPLSVAAVPSMLEKLWDYQTSDLFSEAERVALDFALAAASIPNAITEELFSRLRKEWDNEQIVEILGVVSFFGYLNRWNDSIATALEDPAKYFASDLLGEQGWHVGKHS